MLDSRDPRRLCDFYERLLGWQVRDYDEDWCKLLPPEGLTGLSIQLEPDHRSPTWPSGTAEQMQVHLDFEVTDLEQAVAHAIEAGARLADWQPQDNVRVLSDPDGHVFCLFKD